MLFRLVIFVGTIFLSTLPCALKAAGITTIAITGTDAPGIIGGKFSTLEAGPLNDSGKVVFQADLTHGLGGVTSADDEGVWLFDGSSLSLVAREGSNGVPEVLSANFQSFSDVAIDTANNIFVRASLQTGAGGVTSATNQATWKYSNGVGELLARTGSGNTPGVVGGDYAAIPQTLQVARNGKWVHNSTLAVGVAGVTGSNNNGLWGYDGGTETLIARESVSSVPGILSAQFSVFGIPLVNANHQVAFVGSLNLTPGITSANNIGVWQYTGTSGAMLARTGTGGVPGMGGANFTVIGLPSQNSSGQIAFQATLDVAAAQGVWLYTNEIGSQLAQSGTESVPGVVSAKFDSFEAPLLNNAGQVLVKADLEHGFGGVAADNDSGLWVLDGAGSLVARTGSGGVPGLPGVNFLEFSTYSLNSLGQIALAATLETGDDIDSSNDSGLWILDPSGNSQLIAQEGDMLAGQTIASLGFLGGSGGGDSRASGWNNTGKLAFQATFTNGDSGIFMFSLVSADFDEDGDVDSADLGMWETAMGVNANGDADSDGDSDGADFLIWQRQSGEGVPTPAVVTRVPEAGSETLFVIAGILVFSRVRFRRC